MDEELHPGALGLATTAALLQELRFEGHVVCGHTCALAAQDEATALATLDAVARSPDHPGHPAHHQSAAAGRRHRPHPAPARPHAGEGSACARHPGADGSATTCRTRSAPWAASTRSRRWRSACSPRSSMRRSTSGPNRCAAATGCARGPDEPPLQPGSAADLVVFDRPTAGAPSRTQARVVLRPGRVASGMRAPQGTWPTPDPPRPRLPLMSAPTHCPGHRPAPGPLRRVAPRRRLGLPVRRDRGRPGGQLIVKRLCRHSRRGAPRCSAARASSRTDFKEGPILAQSWYVLDRIRLTVEAAGGQMARRVQAGAVLQEPRPLSALQPGAQAVLHRRAAGLHRGARSARCCRPPTS